MHEDAIFQDSPSAVPRREILSLKRFPIPVFSDRSTLIDSECPSGATSRPEMRTLMAFQA